MATSFGEVVLSKSVFQMHALAMIQLTRNGLRGTVDLVALRKEFARNHVVRFPQLLADDIVDKISRRFESGLWIDNVHPGINKEILLDDQQATQLLLFVTSTPDFLSIIRQITACDKIASFGGRIYRMPPGADFEISWHNDIVADQGRLVGMSINLSPRAYSGGIFQLRRADSEPLLCELQNNVLADAILFRISPDLKHRVTPVVGTEPKIAFAGWFMSSGVDFLAEVKRYAPIPQ